jgi:predicted phage terminase large subunit-like protein
MIIISWDTAMKATETADFSVGTVWLVQKKNAYLLDLVRGRYDYPDLKRVVFDLHNRWPGSLVLVEDKASGTSLIQDLKSQQIPVIAVRAETDKVTRLCAVQAQFESGSIYFPQVASWSDDLTTKLLAFPQSRHDDQVDSIGQALTWIAQKRRSPRVLCVPPIIVPLRNPYAETFCWEY